MTHGKDAGKSVGPPDPRTPFARFADFAKRLIAVPKSEMNRQERLYQHRRTTRAEQKRT